MISGSLNKFNLITTTYLTMISEAKLDQYKGNGDQAIVIGGSIAGLLAARVLADVFDQVRIVERDQLPEQPDLRKGVPQSAQPHVLFTRGYQILEELFPDIGAELSAAGALTIDWAREFDHFVRGQWNAKANSPSQLVSFTCSRPLLEWAIRRRLSNSNVQFLQQSRVTGLLYDGKRVNGVRLQGVGGSGENIPAKLVVDASGRGSQAPKWLESLGFTPPAETVVNPFLGYATRRYRLQVQADWKVMLIDHSPPDRTRLGYMAQIEAGEWIVTLGGYGRDFPPIDNQGFLEFARSLPSPKLYEAIQHAEPVSPIYAHRATANRMHHYEKIMLPEGFICLGDAVCALCPVYGQGMTVSALAAIVLRDWLHEQSQGTNGNHSSTRFQKKLAKSNALAWAIATGQDSRFPTTAGRIQPGRFSKLLSRLLRQYTDRLLRLANEDSSLQTLVMEIGHFLKSPLVLYHPKVMFRVLSRR